MFFKAISAFKLEAPLNLNDLVKTLPENTLREPGALEMSTLGFVPVVGKLFVRVVEKYAIIRLGKTEKIIPAAVLNSKTAKKIAELEETTGEPLSKKSRQDVKEQVLIELMAVAFHKTTYTYAMITKDYVIINSPSSPATEAMLTMMRKQLGSLPVTPVVMQSLSSKLTSWASVGPEDNFKLLEEIKLLGGQGEQAKFKGVDILEDDRIKSLIGDSYFVDELAIEFDESISSNLTSEGVFKSVHFSDVLLEQNDDIPKDQEQARLDADIVIAGSEMVRLVNWLSGVFDDD